MRRLCVLAVLATLAACAPVTPPHLVAAPAGAGPVPARVMLRLVPVAGEAPPPLAGSFAQALEAALARHGVQVAADAPYAIDVALALRADGTGITADKSGTLKTLHWLSASRRRHLFDSCAGQRLRITLTGTPAGGAPTARGAGELAGCAADPMAMATLAEQFAGALTR